MNDGLELQKRKISFLKIFHTKNHEFSFWKNIQKKSYSLGNIEYQLFQK